jgi:hypothetical protein
VHAGAAFQLFLFSKKKNSRKNKKKLSKKKNADVLLLQPPDATLDATDADGPEHSPTVESIISPPTASR